MSEPGPSRDEIRRILAVAERELGDAAVVGLSPDGSFEHAYSAALATATVVLRSEGLRVHGQDHHRMTFDELSRIAGGRWKDQAGYFQHCRVRRNRVIYDQTGAASEAEATDLRGEAKKFLAETKAWLAEAHPDLMGPHS